MEEAGEVRHVFELGLRCRLAGGLEPLGDFWYIASRGSLAYTLAVGHARISRMSPQASSLATPEWICSSHGVQPAGGGQPHRIVDS